MSDELAGKQIVHIGVYRYTITPGGGTQTPPEYRVTVTRQKDDEPPEQVGQVHFSGVLMHAFVENSALMEAVIKEIKAAIPKT
jgi:hypothetical protein